MHTLAVVGDAWEGKPRC